MPANDLKDTGLDKLVQTRNVWYLSRVTFLLLSLLGSALLLASFGCAPSSSSMGGKEGSSAPVNDLPEITDELIRERIDNAWVREVPDENGIGEPILWNFDRDEPKEIVIVEKQVDGTRATIVLDIKTRSASRVRDPRQLAGQIRTEWELRTGWVLRRWEIVGAENISMKYIRVSKPPAQNQNDGQ